MTIFGYKITGAAVRIAGMILAAVACGICAAVGFALGALIF